MCASTCSSAIPTDASTASRDTGEPEVFFEPNTKCCTFHPHLPNYLVGAILSDERPEMAEGRRRILSKIERGDGVTPYGINAPGKYLLMYQGSREFFGRSLEMRCPYYVEEGGLCSVWLYREAVCSTFFCKFEAGADGRRYYTLAKEYLSLAERQLSRYVIDELYADYLARDLHPADPPKRKLERHELEEAAVPEAYRAKIWGSWKGLEKEYFEESFQLVKKLAAKDVEKLMGLDGDLALKDLEKARLAMVEPNLPKTLKLNAGLTTRFLDSGEVVMGAYSELDALALPVAAHRLLQEFRGDQTVAEVRQTLRSEKQADFSEDVLLSLYRHRVLVEP